MNVCVFRISSVLGVLTLLSWFLSTPLYAQEPDYILSVSSEAGVVGGTVEVTVSLTVNGLEVSEYELNICDGPLVEIASVGDITPGAGIESLEFLEHEITYEDDRWSVSAALDATENVLAGVATYELYRVTYTLLEKGTTDITFCDTSGANTVNGEVPTFAEGSIEASSLVFVRGDINGDGSVVALQDAWALLAYAFAGGPEPPCRAAADVNDNGTMSGLSDSLFLLNWALRDGDAPPAPGPYKCGPDPSPSTLTCEAPPDPCGVEFDPAPDADYSLSLSNTAGSIKSVVAVTLTMDSKNGDPVLGAQFGVCYDTDLLATETGNFIFGEGMPEMPYGPGYFALRFFDEGWTVGMLFELTFTNGWQIDPADGIEFYTIYYNTLDTPGMSALEFCELGDPPVKPMLLTVDGEIRVPVTSGGTVTILDANLFKRGDCNGNGSVEPLSDAFFLLKYGFLDGGEPPCIDAADFDDNGELKALTDAVQLLRYGFLDGDVPPDPGPKSCGVDPTDDDQECLSTSDGCL